MLAVDVRILVVLAGWCASAAPAAAMARPNVVLFVIDDLGYGELGCQGNRDIPTPHIDSLARGGSRMTAGYVTASFCSPSRAGMLTGRYQTRFGHELNPIGRENLDPRTGLSLAERTLADELGGAGYVTGLVGKWHLGGTPAYHPLRRGFAEFFGFLHEGHVYVPPPYQGVVSFLRRKELPTGADPRWTEGNIVWTSHLGSDEPPYDADNPILRGEHPRPEPEYLTDALTREAVAFIDRHQKAPFFLLVAYNAVHSPMQAATRYLDRFQSIEDIHRRVFAAMLANLDDGVGAVLGKLRDAGIEGRTLVVLVSDHGGPTRELTSSNYPLRGGKGDLYEGGIRVPFLVRWPGVVPAGAVHGSPVMTTDLLPTFRAAAGLGRPGDRLLDGIDLVPLLTGLTGRANETRTFYWRMGGKAALRQGDWKIVRPAGGKQAGWELYRLDTDPGETSDLAASKPATLARLVDQWHEIDAPMRPSAWQRPGRD